MCHEAPQRAGRRSGNVVMYSSRHIVEERKMAFGSSLFVERVEELAGAVSVSCTNFLFRGGLDTDRSP